jgi:Protein of unknown function (DUF4065)
MLMPFQFDKAAATAAMLYLASELTQADLHRVYKLLYLADKLHLARYGRLIAGDSYLAFTYGPVPNEMSRVVEKARMQPGKVSPDNTFVIEDKRVPWRSKPLPIIRPLQQPELDYLSSSDIECLDEAIRVHGGKSFDELTLLSHDSAWEKADEFGIIELEDIVNTLDGAASLLAHLENPYP